MSCVSWWEILFSPLFLRWTKGSCWIEKPSKVRIFRTLPLIKLKKLLVNFWRFLNLKTNPPLPLPKSEFSDFWRLFNFDMTPKQIIFPDPLIFIAPKWAIAPTLIWRCCNLILRLPLDQYPYNQAKLQYSCDKRI